MLRFELSRRAERDIARAREWYDRQRPALGDQLVDAVYAAIRLASRHPNAYAEGRRHVRRVRCRGFPYLVHFRLAQDHVDVIAVYHTSRDPERAEDAARE